MRKTLTFLLFVLATGLYGQEYSTGKYHSNANGLMMGGYDPVSYFSDNGPIKGSELYQVKHDGVSYHFANNDNLEEFKRDLEKYIPAYGGFCAFGLGMDPAQTNGFPQGRYKTSPLSFKIIEKRLYLFYPQNEWPALTNWNQNEKFFKKRAEAKWKEIKGN